VTARGACILVTGSDPVAVASGINYYLKYVANCSISWWGDQLSNLPDGPLPKVAEDIVMNSTYEYRYYMNVCTFGYSTAFWYVFHLAPVGLSVIVDCHHV
jgi:alpha-N-acetylglucosaminidase